MKEKNVSQQDADAKADLLVLSDRIYTAELSQPWVEAFTVKDGEFTYVGDLKGAINHIGPSTVVVDASGRMVIPGIVDNHSHYLWIGALTSMMPWNLFNCTSEDQVKAVVKETAGKNPKLPLIGGIGWRLEYIKGGKPHKSKLDEAVSKRPVLLMSYGGQSGWANTEAVKRMLLNPEALNELSPELGEDGEPTGFFKRFHCFNPFEFFEEDEMITAERPMIMAMWRSVNEALSLGITSVNDVQMYEQFYSYIEKFKDQGGLHRLRARVSLYVGPGMFKKIDKLKKTLAWWTGLKSGPYPDDHLKVGDSVKFYIDGLYSNHTAFLGKPYYDDPKTVGTTDWTKDQFNAVINLVDSMNLQACTHACGDAGTKWVIDSYQLAAKTNRVWDRRHRIEHAVLPLAADQARMASSGILAAMQPTHLAGGPAEIYLGPERIQLYMPWRSMIDAGIDVSFGSDWCAGPANPAYGLLVAAARLNYKLESNWAPEQAVPFEEALYLYTAKSAHALKMEDKIGSIKKGKRADFVIFSEDLTDILTYRHILTKKSEMGTGLDDLVLATFTDGKIAYCKSGWTMLEVRKADVNFHFTANKEADSLSMKGTFEWPKILPFPGAKVSISVGDLKLDFTLDKKGQGRLDKNTVLTIRPALPGIMRFNLKIRKAVLFDSFKSYGFTQNTDIKIPGEKLSVPVVFIIDGGMQATMVDFIYTAEAGKSGKGKGKGRPFELPSWLSWFWKEMI